MPDQQKRRIITLAEIAERNMTRKSGALAPQYFEQVIGRASNTAFRIASKAARISRA
jgi:hypothetical protein